MMRRVAAWLLPSATAGLHYYHTTCPRAAPKYNEPATWGIAPGAPFKQAELLAKRFAKEGVIAAEDTQIAASALYYEVRYPMSKAFTAASFLTPGVRSRVNVTALLNGRLNNSASPYTMKLIGRDRQLKQLEKFIKPPTQKSQLIPVVGAMGTGKTQLLKHFLGTSLRKRCESGAVIIVECGLSNNEASDILQQAMFTATKAPRGKVLGIVSTALNKIVKLHLEEYFSDKLKSDKRRHQRVVDWWGVWKEWLPPECPPLLVLDTTEFIFTKGVEIVRNDAPHRCTLIECIMRALPSQLVVIAAATLPTKLAGRVPDGTNFTVKAVDMLGTLTLKEYTLALTESWDAEMDDVDKNYAVPLFYYLGGGIPRHLQVSTEPTTVRAVNVLGHGWKEAVDTVYQSAEQYLHIAVRRSGSPAKDIHAEFWTAAVAAATKYPAKYSDLVVGTTDGKTYADVASFCAASEAGTLRIPPIYIHSLCQHQLLQPPQDWPQGASLVKLFTPFDRSELVLRSRRPDTPRGGVYECLIAHSLVGRWWLLQKEKGRADVPLCDLLCDSSRHLKGYTVNLSGGIVRRGDKDRDNALQWNVSNDKRHGTAIHDMIIPCSKGGQGVTIPIQIRHGHAKTLNELSKQLEDVRLNYPGLIVIHNKAYVIPGYKATSVGRDGKWLVYVDGGAFARDDAVYAVAPFTRE